LLEPDEVDKIRIQGATNEYKSHNVANLLSGKSYALKVPYSINTRFFQDMEPTLGTLVYDDSRLDSIQLLYDVVDQYIIILQQSFHNQHYIRIDDSKVSQFSFNGHRFYRIKSDSLLKRGFYEIIYSDEIYRILAKRVKSKQASVKDNKLQIEFNPTSSYFLQDTTEILEVSGKKKFFKALELSEDENRYLRRSNIAFSKRNYELWMKTILKRLEIYRHKRG